MKFITTVLLLTTCLLPFSSMAQDGTLDNTFDGDGKLTTDFGAKSESVNFAAVQSDGKIVVAGATRNAVNFDFALARYNTNGSLDVSFDSDGKLTTPNGNATCIAIQSDGKILVGGNSDNGTTTDFSVVRYNTNGSLDNTFDTDGKVVIGFNEASANSKSIKIQPDGKIVIAGYSINTITGASDFALARLNTNGSLDTSFDTDGKLTTDFNDKSGDYCTSIALQTDGKIIAAGYINIVSDIDFAVIRYNTDGSLDPSFDTDGKASTTFSSNFDYVTSVAIQTDGKILVAGETANGIERDNAIVRYNTNGSLDITFDTDGKLTTNVGSSDNGIFSIAIQSDGKIVATGYATNSLDFEDVSLVRYNSNGSLDNNFDTDGVVTYTKSSSYLAGNSVAIQDDGKIVVAGGDGTDFLVLRFNNTFRLGINTNIETNSGISIYPNPFSSETTLHTNTILQNATLIIYNSLGEKINEIHHINGQTITLSRDNLPRGIYFINLTKNNDVFAVKKLIIED